MTRTVGTHGYICECPSAGCRERIYLRPDTYTRLSRGGAIVSKACARKHSSRRTILADYGEFAVVFSSQARVFPSRLDRIGWAY